MVSRFVAAESLANPYFSRFLPSHPALSRVSQISCLFTEAGENVSVHFTGLLAHWFENVIRDNILFGMDEITVDGFFEQYKDLLGGAVSYGFPACCSIEELRERMDREHIRVFVIDASLGLCGFVLAQEVELKCP